MRHLFGWLALLGAVLGAQATPSEAANAGKIVYGYFSLNVVRPDGSSGTQISGDQENAPDFNRDGSKIVFTRPQSLGGGSTGAPQIYTANADGTNATRLTFDQAQNFGPKWSPDGTQIVFASNRTDTNPAHQGAFEIYVMNADGTSPRRLTRDSTDDLFPDFSPDGKRIVFSSRRDGLSEDGASLFVMNTNGTDLRRLTPPGTHDFNAAWNPNGATIAFASSDFLDGPADVYTFNVAQALAGNFKRTRLTFQLNDSFFPAWSPDGTQLVLASYNRPVGGTFAFRLYTIRDDGFNLRLLSEDADFGVPSWGPGSVPAGGFLLPRPLDAKEKLSASALSETVPFVISLGHVLTRTVTVGYATSDGTAKAGSDYKPVRGRVTIKAGAQSATVAVPIINDDVAEGAETFGLSLFLPVGAPIIESRREVKILDNDNEPELTVELPEENGIYRSLTAAKGTALDANKERREGVDRVQAVLYRFETISRGRTYPGGFFNGQTWTPEPDENSLTDADLFGEFFSIALPDASQGFVSGRYILTVLATDENGNQSFKDVPFTLDDEAPSLSITTPTFGARLFNNATIRGTVRDMASGTRAVTCTVYRFREGDRAGGYLNTQGAFDATFKTNRNALPATLAQVTDAKAAVDWKLALPSLPVGHYSVRAFGEDLAGNRVASGFVRFSIEATPKEPSTASASVATQSIRLVFVRGVDFMASPADAFRVTINGRQATLTSIGENSDGRIVTLNVPRGDLKAGDQVVVAFHDLFAPDGGSPISGQTEVLTAG